MSVSINLTNTKIVMITYFILLFCHFQLFERLFFELSHYTTR